MYHALNVPPSQTPPKTLHYSPMLHNALVALALGFLDEPFRNLKTRQCYAIHAKSFMKAECRKPNLSAVRALSVLGSFHSSQGDRTVGHMYLGMACSCLCRWDTDIYLVQVWVHAWAKLVSDFQPPLLLNSKGLCWLILVCSALKFRLRETWAYGRCRKTCSRLGKLDQFYRG